MGVGELGLRPSEFWALTPAEFLALVDGYRRVQVRRSNDLVSLAWWAAAFARQDRLPALKDLLQDPEAEPVKEEQSPDTMFGLIRMMNAAYGGTEGARE